MCREHERPVGVRGEDTLPLSVGHCTEAASAIQANLSGRCRLTDQQHHNDLRDRRRRGRLTWQAQSILLLPISRPLPPPLFRLQVRPGRAIDAVRDWETTIITAVAAVRQARCLIGRRKFTGVNQRRCLVVGVTLGRNALRDCHFDSTIEVFLSLAPVRCGLRHTSP
jgi:hypothetical protein